MPTKPQVYRAYQPVKPRENRDSAAKRGYGHKWRIARLAFLRDNPLCVQCEAEGRIEPATDVDHIVPHKGDEVSFWQGEWQGLCEHHHGIKTLKEGAFGKEIKSRSSAKD